ncbi:ZIP family metal transporter [Methanoculleus receptaculi]|jgi:ZIP family zinc transporter|uniref:ZIP family metal transporter n=1 Tax=Methanoculleus receptaculi TaxID=394967 RepID=A0AAX4FVQ6_9EURY|nr:ZIP family metal transporter [Methanoculleus receptaculi]WOX57984.1 ZIP family metal transporter [Methanoculleus receptaculi]
MIDLFLSLPPVVQALLGGCFTWSFTALGAAVVFMTRRFNQRLLDGMMGFAGGVMVAASFWSLLIPALDLAEEMEFIPWLPVASGFAAGWIFLMLLDRIIPHLHIGFPVEEAEGMKSSLHHTTLLVLAITMHNIPEGLAIGVAFGAVALAIPQATIAGAMALTIGIAIQNFPEGLAVSMPLRREGISRLRCFWYGQLSAVVEPVMAVIGAAVVILARPALPVALAFAAGAMVFVVIEEVIPESLKNGFEATATSGFLAGFLVMMILDVGLG